MDGRVTDPRAKAVLAGGGATAVGATLAAGKLASKKKNSPAKNHAIRAAAKLKAKRRIEELRKISNADINKREKAIKNAHLSNQKSIVNGKKSKTLLQLAKFVGLRGIPAVGAFISAFSSTPAGEGSDLGLGDK
tara:strand:+ start:8791 stop:9192 length:402 start_codon:yes stop_codon:yes gene_type:complete